VCGTEHGELSGGYGHGRVAQKAASFMVDLFGRLDSIHSESPWFNSWFGSSRPRRQSQHRRWMANL